MQDNNTPGTTPIIRQGMSIWYMSIGIFILMILLIIGLSVSKYLTQKNNQKIQSDITALESQIASASADRKTVIAGILESNTIRPSIDIKGLVRDFRVLAAKERVRFQGFSVKNDTITTTLIATEGSPEVHPDPIATIIGMMRNSVAPGSKFTLSPIQSVTGDPARRTTSISLTLSDR